VGQAFSLPSAGESACATGVGIQGSGVGLDDSLFLAVGGVDGCRALAAAFYARVARDPVLRPVYPASLHCSTESLATFFVQFFGGPSLYSPLRWSLSLREAHSKFRIGPKERRAWLKNMGAALEDVGIAESAREALRQFFDEASAHLMNRGAGSQPADAVDGDLARRWHIQRSLDHAVAAIRAEDEHAAIALIETDAMESYFQHDRAALLSLLVMMSDEYARRRLAADPTLAQERYSRGRTLLHGMAGEGRLAMVELLLNLGADANATDLGGHTPLYCVGNECSVDTAPDVVRALVQSGAQVNANGGVKHCTALHMAARRGNVAVAEALLDCGADLDAQDGVGVTPLRRAVNCRKRAMAEFLRARGAVE
jgi:hemoglobin